jgi:diguanylate cyclase (GGDEF)-like protein
MIQAARKGAPTPNKQSPANELSSVAAIRIVQEAVRDGVGIEELARLAQSDPAFAVRVLNLVNSPALARAKPVRDISQAASLLGARGLRNIALSLAVGEMVPSAEEGTILLVQSLRRAIAALVLAEALGHSEPQVCFTVGLLLDVGVLVRARTDLAAALEVSRLPAEHRVLHEHIRFGEAHPAVGARIGTEYKLPDDMIAAIAGHHDDAIPEAKLSRIAWLAERIAGVFETGAVGQAREQVCQLGVGLGMTAARMDALFQELPARVEHLAATFERDVGPQPDLHQLRDDANARLVEMNRQYEETVATLRRVLEEKETLAKRLEELNLVLATQAATDALTGLPNRRALEQVLARDLARAERTGDPLSVVLLDVDHFKRFNDTYGHLVGDQVLRHMSGVVQRSLREGDFVARYGGEEFCLVLPRATQEGALLAARRVRMAIERNRLKCDAGELSVTSSFGVTTYLPGVVPRTYEALFKEADEALYAAKEQGRNCVVHFFAKAGVPTEAART